MIEHLVLLRCFINGNTLLKRDSKPHIPSLFNQYKYVIVAFRVFQQTVGIPMGNNCASRRLAPLFVKADFIHGLLTKNEIYPVLSTHDVRFFFLFCLELEYAHELRLIA